MPVVKVLLVSKTTTRTAGNVYFLKSLICSSSNFIYLWHIWTQYCPKCIFWLPHVCAGDIWSISGLSKDFDVDFFACHFKLCMMISRVKLYSYWLWWSRFNFKVWYIDRLKPDLNIVAFERYNWKLMAYQCCCTVVTRLSLMTQQCSSPLQLVDNCVYTLLQLDGWSGSSPVTAPWLTMFIPCYSSMTHHVYTLLELDDSPCLYPVTAPWLSMFIPC